MNFDFEDLGDIFGDIFGGFGGRGAAKQKEEEICSLRWTYLLRNLFLELRETFLFQKFLLVRLVMVVVLRQGLKWRHALNVMEKEKINDIKKTIFGAMQSIKTCDVCHGSGKVPKEKCDTCH